ncbi:MAG: helix-turn-helix transcriptional regulator [Caulobacterales bacterium]|nr:helix-turn-helix transcriptional regulator [Caulobacterales bacterium]
MPSNLSDYSYRAFVGHLTQLRRAAGVSQAELGARLGKPQSWVHKIERHQRRADPAEFWKWCAALGLDAPAEFGRVVAQLEAPPKA